MRFPNLVRQFWAWVHRVPKPDFTTERVTIHPAPDRIKLGKIIVVGDRQIQKWACFQCPGGCGEVIKLSLNHNHRPCWSVQFDRFDRPTFSPSIRQINDCQCHFWIKEGRVEWCNQGKPILPN